MKEISDKAFETKKNIWEAFCKLYKDKEIHQITIQSITDLAGYNRGTFYVYFADIYDMLDQLKEYLYQEMRKFAEGMIEKQQGKNPDESVIDEMIRALLTFYEDKKRFMLPIGLRDAEFVETTVDAFLPFFKKHMSRSEDLDEQMIRYYATYQISAVSGVINRWYRMGQDRPTEEIMDMLIKISRNGFLPLVMDDSLDINGA